MRRIAVIMAIIAVLCTTTPVAAWGSNTHLEIDRSISDSELFQQGSIFPDMALGLHYAERHLWEAPPDNWQEIHTDFHSSEFADSLWVSCKEHDVIEFAEGWVCHTLGSDPIESAYSRDKINQGAPMSADYPVDWYYHGHDLDTHVSQDVRLALQQAIDQTDLGWTLSDDAWDDVRYVYQVYLDMGSSWYIANGYAGVAEEWYSDNAEYLAMSVAQSVEAISEYHSRFDEPESEPAPRGRRGSSTRGGGVGPRAARK